MSSIAPQNDHSEASALCRQVGTSVERVYPLSDDDIELLLDHLVKGMTDAKWKKDPKRAEAVYELYQTIGQALGEVEAELRFKRGR